MQRQLIKTDNINLLYERFENTHELVSTLSQRTANDSYKGGRLTKDRLGKDWHGVDNISEAHDLLYYGWKQKIDLFKQQIKVNSASLQYKKQPRLIADYVGGAPIVANAIIGLPMAMVGTKYKPKRKKIVHLLIDCGVNAGYSSEAIITWGAKVVAIINRLEQEGYRCKVEVMYGFGERHGKTQQVLRFKVKDEGHPIDLQRFTFPMAHPAMFRAIGFHWEETVPGGKAVSGKGTPLNQYTEFQLKEIIDLLTSKDDNVIYANVRTDLEEVLKNKIGWTRGKEVK